MSDIKLNPYLSFKNNAREAMEFYEGVFGGELTLQTFAEGMGDTTERKDLIMHSALESDDLTIMGSDAMKVEDIVEGTNVSLSLSGTDEAKLTKYFEALSDGGTVTEPLKQAPWGDTFGMLTDQYGIYWLINITSEQS